MEGIHFVTNEKGRKIAVQIDLDRHGELWEGIYDQLLAEERAGDKRIPYETVRERLVRSGKLVRDYQLTIATRASKDLAALPAALAQRVDAAILALKDDVRGRTS